MSTDFTGLLIIPSVPMFIAALVLFVLILLTSITLFFLNREIGQREAALPTVTTRGIKSPEWSLAYESAQVFYCALCNQANISVATKIYYSRVDPQTLLVVGVHRCPAQTVHVPAVKPKHRRPRGYLRKYSLLGVR